MLRTSPDSHWATPVLESESIKSFSKNTQNLALLIDDLFNISVDYAFVFYYETRSNLYRKNSNPENTKRGPTSKAETMPNNKMEDKVSSVLA
jgi:hypothetical protein